MNKLTKIGVSALAGSLAISAANAIEMNVSGSAGAAFATSDENLKGDFYQYDSVILSASGETDGGITVSASYELDGSPWASTSSYDNKSFSFGTDSMGTVTFHGHGGSSVMGQWDDVTPNAMEEVWDGTSGADVRIDGRSGNNLIAYDSPSISGVTFKLAHVQAADSATASGNDIDESAYTDWGIQIAPEMVEGLTLGYAQATMEDSATTEIDQYTYFIKYAVGGATIGYQYHEADGHTAATTDESTTWGVSYAVSDAVSISYGQRDYNDNTASDTANSQEQEDSGFSVSYTMGGMTISGHMNSTDNVGGNSNATADKESYEIGLSFAF